jgi:hypothetical protein
MQKLRSLIPMPFAALPLPYKSVRIATTTNESRLTNWLNGKRIGLHLHGIGELIAEEDLPEFRPPTEEEDADSRRRVIEEVLPLLRHMASIPGHRSPAGLTQRESLMDLLGLPSKGPVKRRIQTYSTLARMADDGEPLWFVTGPRAVEGWAAHVLISMWRENRLSLLTQCSCGCGKWLMRRRKNQRFWAPACRVRFHQSDPAFKAKHREKAKDYYAHHRREREKGKVEVGYTRGNANKRSQKAVRGSSHP